MEWKHLSNIQQLNDIIDESHLRPVVIFKHSTRCSISHMVKGRLDKAEAPSGLPFYYLDLIQYRPLSNEIAERFSVQHESPQVLLVSKGICIYDESHNGIQMDELMSQLTV